MALPLPRDLEKKSFTITNLLSDKNGIADTEAANSSGLIDCLSKRMTLWSRKSLVPTLLISSCVASKIDNSSSP